MNKACKHHNVKIVEETEFGKKGICENCNLEIPIIYFREGYYAVVLGDKNYTINPDAGINISENCYAFQIGNTDEIFYLYNDIKVKEQTYSKQLCKSMKK